MKCCWVTLNASVGVDAEYCGKPTGFTVVPDDDGNRRRIYDALCPEHKAKADRLERMTTTAVGKYADLLQLIQSGVDIRAVIWELVDSNFELHTKYGAPSTHWGSWSESSFEHECKLRGDA